MGPRGVRMPQTGLKGTPRADYDALPTSVPSIATAALLQKLEYIHGSLLGFRTRGQARYRSLGDLDSVVFLHLLGNRCGILAARKQVEGHPPYLLGHVALAGQKLVIAVAARAVQSREKRVGRNVGGLVVRRTLHADKGVAAAAGRR